VFITPILGAVLTVGSLATMGYRQLKAYFTPPPEPDYFLDDFRRSLQTHKIIDETTFVELTKYDKTDYGFHLKLRLPQGITIASFKKVIPAIEQDLWCKIKFKHIFGRDCEMHIGKKDLNEKISFSPSMITDGLKVPLMSHFGLIHFDLYDEASWHLLVGGAARTGKTVFLRLLLSSIMEGMKGKLQVHLSTTKASDFYMFPNINLTDDVNETIQMLNDILIEAKRRKDLLKEKGNVIDLKHFREVYPDEPMEPIILIIDEYARLADIEEIQEVVMELIETYSYVDVHIILATQRPDATTVLKPRIKANIIARMGLTTADENNSKLIIGSEDCAYLGGIKGRAILLDGIMETVQVPYINPKQCEEIARRFKKYGTQLERQIDNQITTGIQSLESQSISNHDLLGRSTTYNDGESSPEKIG